MKREYREETKGDVTHFSLTEMIDGVAYVSTWSEDLRKVQRKGAEFYRSWKEGLKRYLNQNLDSKIFRGLKELEKEKCQMRKKKSKSKTKLKEKNLTQTIGCE